MKNLTKMLKLQKKMSQWRASSNGLFQSGETKSERDHRAVQCDVTDSLIKKGWQKRDGMRTK